MTRRRRRLDPGAFQLPTEALRAGQVGDASSLAARVAFDSDPRPPRITVQLSAESSGVVAGIDEALAVLRLGADDWTTLAVHALYDGDRIEAWETVLTVEGPRLLKNFLASV